MVTVTYLPLCVTILFRGMPGMWKSRHRLVLCWLVVMQALFPGRKTLEDLAHWTSASMTAWRFRRVLKAADWDVHLLVAWWGQAALTTSPPCHPPRTGSSRLWVTGVTKPSGARRIPWPNKGVKASIIPGFSASGSPC
jgi:hypothetical protein